MAVVALLAALGLGVALSVPSAANPATDEVATSGVGTCRTDDAGMCTVRHSLGAVPAHLRVKPQSSWHRARYRLSVVPESVTAEQFQLLAVGANGLPRANRWIRFRYWMSGVPGGPTSTTTSTTEPSTSTEEPTTTTTTQTTTSSAPPTTTSTTTPTTSTATSAPNPPASAGETAPQACTQPKQTWPTNDGGGPLDGAGYGDGKDYYGGPDLWNDNGTVTMSMGVCSFHSWNVDVTAKDLGDGGVLAYPNTHKDWHNWSTDAEPRVSSFDTIPTHFAETNPGATGAWNASYDAWFNGVADSGSTELMIWNRWHDRSMSGFADRIATVTIGGRAWDVYATDDRKYIAFLAQQQFDSGRLDVKQFSDYLVANGLLPADSTLGAIDYGTEIVSTGGQQMRFGVTDFQVDAY